MGTVRPEGELADRDDTERTIRRASRLFYGSARGLCVLIRHLEPVDKGGMVSWSARPTAGVRADTSIRRRCPFRVDSCRVFSIDRILDLFHRLGSYSPVQVFIELLLIWLAVYFVFRFVQGTRAAGVLKGLLILVIAVAILSRLLGQTVAFQRLGVLYDRFLALTAVALIVIFQPELRRALVRLGEAPFFRSTPKDIALIVNEIADACAYLSKAKFGALIAIERQVGLRGLTEGGVVLNADLSARLLQTIFFPGSALHDLAVVVRGKQLYAAGVQLPLADPEDMPDPSLGSRHRAAVGLSKECDALIVVVSEETGTIRIAERGRLSAPLSANDLRFELKARLGKSLRQSADMNRATQTSEERQETELRAAALEQPIELDPDHASTGAEARRE